MQYLGKHLPSPHSNHGISIKRFDARTAQATGNQVGLLHADGSYPARKETAEAALEEFHSPAAPVLSGSQKVTNHVPSLGDRLQQGFSAKHTDPAACAKERGGPYVSSLAAINHCKSYTSQLNDFRIDGTKTACIAHAAMSASRAEPNHSICGSCQVCVC